MCQALTLNEASECSDIRAAVRCASPPFHATLIHDVLARETVAQLMGRSGESWVGRCEILVQLALLSRAKRANLDPDT